MFRQFAVASTGMTVLEKELVTITDNMSNVKTPAFKSSRVETENLFPEILEEALVDPETKRTEPAGIELGSGVGIAATTRSFTQGTVEVTNNPLDIAIQGDGFFRMLLADGSYAYSRAGNLHKDKDGRIVDPNGNLLDPEIVFPEDTTNILINTDGTVYIQQNNELTQSEVGQIALVRFPNPAGLQSMGNNLYVETEASGEPVEGIGGEEGYGQIAQYSLESSNVDIIEEMLKLILTQRAFDVISKAIQTGEAILNSALEIARA